MLSTLRLQQIEEQNILWEDALITFAISDLRGVKEALHLQWGEARLPLAPGSKLKGFPTGVFARPGNLRESTGLIPMKLELTLNGSGGIRFAPVADQNMVQLASPWPDPSFQGAFLPTKRNVTAAGFTADWQLSYYGRDFAQHIFDPCRTLQELTCFEHLIRQSMFHIQTPSTAQMIA